MTKTYSSPDLRDWADWHDWGGKRPNEEPDPAAAPELMKECEDTLTALEVFRRGIMDEDMIVPMWVNNSIDSLRAVIALARGEE